MHFPHWERKHTLISSYYLHNQKINIWSALRNKPSNQLITLIFSSHEAKEERDERDYGSKVTRLKRLWWGGVGFYEDGDSKYGFW